MRIAGDEDTSWQDKCLVVSALTISLVSNFDALRLKYLINFLFEEEENVWQRAITGIVLGLFEREKVLENEFPKLVDKLELLKQRDNIQIGIKYLMSSLNDMKFKEYEQNLELYNSLLNRIPADTLSELKNFMANMIRSQLAKEDSDFGLYLIFNDFKKNDKFKEPHFWFYPFHTDNIYVKELLKLKDDLVPSALMHQLLLQSITISDSQKYSLCYHYNELTDVQVKRLAEIFTKEQYELKNLAREDIKEKQGIDNAIFRSILNDLYQFQLFFPKHELANIFDFQFELKKVPLTELIGRQDVLIEIESQRYNGLGVAMSDKGDLDGAIQQYQKAIELNPKYANAYNNLGVAMSDKGDLDGAIQQYQKAIELNPKDATVHNNLGITLRRKGNLNEAIIQYKKVIELNPKNAEAYHNLGITLRRKGDLNEAIIQYKKAIELNPNDDTYYNNLGFAYLCNGLLNNSKEALKKSIQIKENGHAYLNLGHIYLAEENEKQAIDNYVKSKKLFNDDKLFIKDISDDFDSCNLQQLGIRKKYFFEIVKYLNKKTDHNRVG